MSIEGSTPCIYDYMKTVLEYYKSLRGKNIDLTQIVFWDAVLISASDVCQKNGYKLQIAEKQRRGEIPLSVPFHVFSDPPDYKIGCGGSTMFILEKVYEIYGAVVQNMRFLLIPAGGYSQRLPNLSVLGKLFSPLPFGESRFQMLDLILACYIPLLKHMPPGVFLASSDAIISYCLSKNDVWTFKNDGFTALAHPSPVLIGTTHGVYVLPENEIVDRGPTCMSDCLRVLQKPSVEEMYNNGAVIRSLSSIGDHNQETIFSDSAFFFDHDIASKLARFYKFNKPLKCELSSYGDFLQPLGSRANPSYIVDKVTTESVAIMQSALYRVLFGTKLTVLALKNSNFHHLGTMQEYIDSFCDKNNNFSKVFPVSKFSFSELSVKELTPFCIQGQIIHSVIHPLSIVPESSIVEYSDVNIVTNIGHNCIISNVQLHGFSIQRLEFQIPDNTLLHTVCLMEGYVTVAFNVQEDIKKTYQHEAIPEIQFHGRKLKSFLKTNEPIFDVECEEISLWNARLFPVCSTADASAKQTLEILLRLTETGDSSFILNRNGKKWVSMCDVLLQKDTEKMVNYQKDLYIKITNFKMR